MTRLFVETSYLVDHVTIVVSGQTESEWRGESLSTRLVSKPSEPYKESVKTRRNGAVAGGGEKK